MAFAPQSLDRRSRAQAERNAFTLSDCLAYAAVIASLAFVAVSVVLR